MHHCDCCPRDEIKMNNAWIKTDFNPTLYHHVESQHMSQKQFFSSDTDVVVRMRAHIFSQNVSILYSCGHGYGGLGKYSVSSLVRLQSKVREGRSNH